MSIKQMKYAFDCKDLNPTQKLIMLALADNANDNGVCFPSWNTIQQKTSLSRGALSSNLKKLSENGLLIQKHRNRKNGSRTSSKYLIFPKLNIEFLDEEEYLIFENKLTQSSADVLSEQDIQSSADVPTNPIQSSADVPPEPSLNTLTITNKKINKKSSLSLQEDEQSFEMFWKHYPKKVEKVKAKKAWLKTKDKPYVDDIIKAVNFYKMTKTVKDGFVCNATTWINGRRWEDEIQLSDYEKTLAILEHTGMTGLELLKQQGRA